MRMAYQHLDINIPLKEPESGLQEVIKVLRPTWKKEDMDVKLLSGGLINKMYGIHLKSDTNLDDGLVIRVNCEATLGLGADRETELPTLLALNSRGLGVPVVASFKNGIVFKFVKGLPLNDDQMRDRHIMSMVAAELARMHAKLPLDTDRRANPLNLTTIVFNSVPKTLDDPEKQSKYAANIPYAELASEFLALQKYLLEQNMELAICHGDLWQGNIMYHQEGGTPPDYKNHYPTHEDRKHFIQHYLKKKIKASGSESYENEAFDEKFRLLYVHVCKCELLALLHLVNMSLYDDIILKDLLLAEFEFLRMATDCWNEYKMRKDKYMKMTPEDVPL